MSKAERTKRFIIEKTAPIFNAKGYAGTSINDLILATGLSKGSIYGNFENKNEVALAAFDYNFKCISSYYKERLSAVEDSIDKLLVYPEIFENYFKIKLLKDGCPILNTATEADDTHAVLTERVVRALTDWRRNIEDEIQRGIERKEIINTTDPREIAIVMISMIEGSLMQSKVSRTIIEIKTAMVFLRKIIEGLRA
ncbi:TetR/AcrR family transcriptional regulator [Chryseobacterium hispalense]|uniref:TetR/AcrR family transcriptional regulator n=1 Tax=Chryseobacterium hispalense TaxID=1453492 RepID=UPI000493A133|nr:TetR/AcrR family transcriptional regulator [Chryseobacterium hispalense]